MADSQYLTVARLDRRQLARLFSKIDIDRVSGCWNWRAGLSTKGYGKTTIGSAQVLAHRLMYAWLVAPLPLGHGRGALEIDHRCMNRACCNPAHLELVTSATNLLRGGGACAKNARKTHCKRGHPLPDAPNRRGARACATCADAQHRDYYAANRSDVITRTAANGKARRFGPQRDAILAKQRARYHATKMLKQHAASPEHRESTHRDPTAK